jgi:Zinc-finger associated domain (zf-AD)/Zinc finger, C2H2 type
MTTKHHQKMEICRLCSKTSSETTPIFSLHGNKLILDLIILICPISIEFLDKFPKQICKVCLNILKSAQSLRERSVVSDNNFRNGKVKLIPSSRPNEVVTIKEEPNNQSSQAEQVEIINYINDDDDDDYNNYDDQMELFNNTGNNSDEEFMMSPKREYSCPHCSQTFTHKSNLNIHIKQFHIHTKEKTQNPVVTVDCHICGAIIKHKTNLKRHIIQYHDPKLKYSCRMCSYRFKSVQQLATHGSKVHEIADMTPLSPERDTNKVEDLEVMSCDICNKKYILKEDLAKHTKRHYAATNTDSSKAKNSIEEFYKCDFCKKSFGHRSNLYRHIDSAHPDESRLTCQYCGKVFRTKMMLYHHFEEAHIDENWDRTEYKENSGFSTVCKICNQHFGGCRSRLERHLIIQHPNAQRLLVCDYCGKNFVFSSSLKPHVEFHVLKKRRQSFPFPCDKCKKRFHKAILLERHK